MNFSLVRAACCASLSLVVVGAIGAPAQPVYEVVGEVPMSVGRVAFPLTAGDGGMMYGVSGNSDTSLFGGVFGVDASGAFTVYRVDQPEVGGSNSVPLVRGIDGAF